MIRGVTTRSFNVIVKEIEFFVRERNTKILYPVNATKKGVIIYQLGLICVIKHHSNTGKIQFRNNRSILDKLIVLSWFKKDVLKIQVEILDESS